MRKTTTTTSSGLDRARRTRALTRVAFATAAAAIGWAVGCSSGSTDGGGAAVICKTVYKGKCGGACKLDGDCDTGLYCGSSGTCTADCAPGHNCSEGSCTAQGRCFTGGGLFGGDGSAGLGTNVNDASACLTDRRRGEGLPSDILIMNDQSLSMSCAIPSGGDRWQAMTTAITGFLNSPDATGFGVGIQYFGLPAGPGDTQGSCDPAVYTAADVEISTLPGNKAALIASLGKHKPSSYTPTPPALEGAIAHAKAWATAHPDRAVSVVLATDGEPNLCGQNANESSAQLITEVAQIADAAFKGTPSIPIYVIGIVGGSAANGGRGCNLDPAPPNKTDLNKVAAAGGTGTAFIVDATAGNTSAQFLDALNKIRGAAVIPCEYVIPTTTSDGQTIDPNQVNISLTPAGKPEQHLTQSSNVGACPANGGWYYDSASPSKIELCPASCDIVKGDPNAALDVLLGCQTVTNSPH